MLRDLKRAGLKLTPQRIAIVRLFASDESHPTAQDLFERLRPRFPSMSFATVYNTLDALARAGPGGHRPPARQARRRGAVRPEHRRRTTTPCATGAAPCSTSRRARSRPRPGAVKKLRRAAPGFSVRAVERIYRGPAARECARERSRSSSTTNTRRTPWPSRFRAPRRTRTSRTPSPASRRRTAATSISQRSPTWRATPRSPATSRRRPTARPGHAHGHLDYLKQVGDPATGLPIGNTEKNLKASVAGETYEYETMYPGMAKTARDEGFDDIAEWFETLAKAEKSHAGRFTEDARRRSRADRGQSARTQEPRQRAGERAAILASCCPGVAEPSIRQRPGPLLPCPRSTPSPSSRPRTTRTTSATGTRAISRARCGGRSRSATTAACASATAARSRTCSRASTATSRSAGPTGAELLDDGDFASATELCWQCKLCYVKCPYTRGRGARVAARRAAPAHAREGAARAAQRRDAAGPRPRRAAAPRQDDGRADGARRELRQREPPRPKGDAEVARASRQSSRSRRSARRAFAGWLARHEPLPRRGSRGHRRALRDLPGDYNFPRIAASRGARAREERLGVVRPEQTCCGMPNLDGGDIDAAQGQGARQRGVARRARSTRAARSSSLQPTCGYMIRKEWPELARHAPRRKRSRRPRST